MAGPHRDEPTDSTIPDPSYDTDLDLRSYRRLYREESAIAFSAIDCVLNGEQGAYASTELTTGVRAYDLLEARGRRALHELPNDERTALFDANVAEGVGFARRLRESLGGHEAVITPGPFGAPGWTQGEYLTFWETLIRTRVRAVYVNHAWEYSNGCTFEFTIAHEHGIPTFDSALQPLSLVDGIAAIERAIADLDARGFDPHRLRLTLERLRHAA